MRRRADWLGAVDKWALANELLELADELSAARLGAAAGTRIRALQGASLERETALIEAVWQSLNGDGQDPQARYARALDTLLARLEAIPHLSRLRIHTRLPVVLPARVTPRLLELLRDTRFAVALVIHANHAQRAIAPPTISATAILARSHVASGAPTSIPTPASSGLFPIHLPTSRC